MSFSLWRFALGTFSLLGLGGCDICDPVCGAQAPGDILIGMISSINAQVEDLNEREQPETYNCKK